jgi:glycosyltransferase involved in cell wall biosynthesis
LNPDRGSSPGKPSVAIFTQQVSHYHAARYRAAAREFGKVRILSVLNAADFSEFLSGESQELDVVRVFAGEAAYAQAARSGELWRRIHAELDAFRPEAVAIAGWSTPESLAAIAWARSNGSRVVVMSESQEHDVPRSTFREALKRRVVSACDAALVGAAAHADYAVRLGIPRERVFLGYDAVDNEHFSRRSDAARSRPAEARSAHGLPERYLLASGRFMKKKNFGGLIAAYGLAIAQNDSGHDLVILGDGPEAANLRQAAASTGMGARIHLPGFRGYEALPDYYGLADGFAHVATTEQWGLVVNEAAAAGLPLVVSRSTGAAALVHEGRNGFLVDPDPADIARGLGLLMSASRERVAQLGAESRRIVDEWGPDRFASALGEACACALRQPARRLSMPDRAILRTMARARISAVQ